MRESYCQLSSRCFIWWWNTASHAWWSNFRMTLKWNNDVILQHDWPIERCHLHIRVFFGGKTKRPCFDLFIHWLITKIALYYFDTLVEPHKNTSCEKQRPLINHDLILFKIKDISLVRSFLHSVLRGRIVLSNSVIGFVQAPVVQKRWIVLSFLSTTGARWLRLAFNPLNPNIKILILICYPYSFPIEVVGRICRSIS